MIRRRLQRGVALVAVGLLAPASAASAATFTVNDPTDAALATSTNTACVSSDAGKCALRAAIQAADNAGGSSTITLPAGTYKLTIAPTSGAGSTDDPATGDLDLDQTNGASSAPAITITGAGADSTFIDANSIDRAFTVHFFASLSISGVAIEHGAPSPHSTDSNNGGAINAAGPLTIINSLVDGNSAAGEGGAIYTTADLTIHDSTLADNVAATAGGALNDAGGGVVSLLDDTFDGNLATGMTGIGGALAFQQTAGAGSQIENVTIAHNIAPDGGGIYSPNNAVAIENTIVAENRGSVGGAPDCYGAAFAVVPDVAGAADLGGNVDSDGTCFSASTAHDFTSTDPKLAALGDNGGTPTDALLAGSPVIGGAIASACVSSDQRGVARLSTFCDPGAYQTIDADLALTAGGPSAARTGQPFTDTFTVANNGPNAAAGVTFSAPVPSGTTATATASVGSCTVATSVTCSLGTLNSALSGGAQSATVTVKLTASRPGTVAVAGSVTATPLDPSAANNAATASANVTGNPPVNTALPQITGGLIEAATLTASAGAWTNAPTRFAYQWQSCSDQSGPDCSDISGATTASYRLTASDVGTFIQVTVTATNADGSTQASSPISDTHVTFGLHVTFGNPTTTGPTATLPVSCGRGDTLVSCELGILLTALGGLGTASDLTTTAVLPAAKHTKVVIVGKEKVTVRAGHRKLVRITLNRTGRRLLARKHRLKVKITITQSGRTVRTRTVTFKAKHH